MDLTHSPGNNDKDACQGSHWDEFDDRHCYQVDEQKGEGMHNAGNGSPSPVVYICCSSCNSTSYRNSSNQGDCGICETHGDEFHIRSVVSTNHAVCNDGGEQGFQRTEEGDGEGSRQQGHDYFLVDREERELGNLEGNHTKTVSDGLHRNPQY